MLSPPTPPAVDRGLRDPVPARTSGPAAADRSPAAARPGSTVRSWPLLVLAAPAARPRCGPAGPGSGVTRFKPGDEVYANLLYHGYGGFAEYASAPADVISLKPANLSFEEAAAVPMAAVTALQGLRHHGEIQPGRRS